MSQIEHFDKLAGRYDTLRAPPGVTAVHETLVREADLAGKRVLDVGCGTGANLLVLAEHFGCTPAGVDSSEAMLAEARRKLPDADLRRGVAERLPFDDASFDAVLSVEMLEHLPADVREPALLEMLRVLRPGGRLIVTFPSGGTATRLDAKLNEAFRRRHGHDHPWAIEHLEHGVPEGHEVAARLRGLVGPSATVALRHHAWAPAWIFQHMLMTVGRLFPLTAPLVRGPGLRALFNVLRRLNRTPAYRAILVVDK